jgi:hypothetical protein
VAKIIHRLRRSDGRVCHKPGKSSEIDSWQFPGISIYKQWLDPVLTGPR